jgi:hypothetical protein
VTVSDKVFLRLCSQAQKQQSAATSSGRERAERYWTMTKTVLVTGATRGIGLKFAEHYVKLGWNVIAAARDPSNAENVWLGLKCTVLICSFI